jgi:phenylacetate-CoA ligase
MLSRAPIQAHGPFTENYSSGSTGHPVTVKTTRWLHDMAVACNWRGHTWAGLDWSKTTVGVMGEIKGAAEGQSLGPWGPPWTGRSTLGKRLYASYSLPEQVILQILQGNGVSYLEITPHHAELLAREALIGKVAIKLDTLILRGEMATEYTREIVRESFCARVVQFYSSKESGTIANYCTSCGSYHCNEEAAFVEIVDKDGLPVTPGQTGRVVVTPFGSTALPLIRYDQGDIATAGQVNKCGRSHKTIASIDGRERLRFVHPDGRGAFVDLSLEMRKLLGAAQCQIAQIGPRTFEVRYVRRDWGVKTDKEAVAEHIKSRLFGDSEVLFRQIDSIPLSKAGKLAETVIEFDFNKPPT